MKSRILCLSFSKLSDGKINGRFAVFSDDVSDDAYLASDSCQFEMDEDSKFIHTKDNDRAKMFFTRLELIYELFDMDMSHDLLELLETTKTENHFKKIRFLT